MRHKGESTVSLPVHSKCFPKKLDLSMGPLHVLSLQETRNRLYTCRCIPHHSERLYRWRKEIYPGCSCVQWDTQEGSSRVKELRITRWMTWEPGIMFTVVAVLSIASEQIQWNVWDCLIAYCSKELCPWLGPSFLAHIMYEWEAPPWTHVTVWMEM